MPTPSLTTTRTKRPSGTDPASAAAHHSTAGPSGRPAATGSTAPVRGTDPAGRPATTGSTAPVPGTDPAGRPATTGRAGPPPGPRSTGPGGARGPLRPTGPAGGQPSGPAGRGPQRPGADAARDAAREHALLLAVTHRFAALYLEVEAGRRSVRHLSALSAAHAHARVRVPAGRGRGGVPGRVRLVTGSRTAADRFDAVATVRRGTRVGAIAIRLVRRDEEWLVDAAGCPEDAVDNVRPYPPSLATRPGLR